jgi:RNase P protein component
MYELYHLLIVITIIIALNMKKTNRDEFLKIFSLKFLFKSTFFQKKYKTTKHNGTSLIGFSTKKTLTKTIVVV